MRAEHGLGDSDAYYYDNEEFHKAIYAAGGCHSKHPDHSAAFDCARARSRRRLRQHAACSR